MKKIFLLIIVSISFLFFAGKEVYSLYSASQRSTGNYFQAGIWENFEIEKSEENKEGEELSDELEIEKSEKDLDAEKIDEKEEEIIEEESDNKEEEGKMSPANTVYGKE